jgi:uncharacterized protein (UPF0210 family)
MSMRIRSITLGSDTAGLIPDMWPEIAEFFRCAEHAFHAAGFDVQTKRLTLDPVTPSSRVSRPALFARMESISNNAAKCGIRWICLPLSLAAGWKTEDFTTLASELIKKFPSVFLHFMAASDGNIHVGRLREAARQIVNISRLSGNGFDNFRVGVGCNIVQNTPYFPFSWHNGDTGFSLAVEPIDALLEVVEGLVAGTPLAEAREKMRAVLRDSCSRIDTVGKELEMSSAGKFVYKGQDMSISPYPDGRRSVVRLLEHFGPAHFGNYGSLAATALFSGMLKETLRDAGARAAGFNGVMYSPLEDNGLAEIIKVKKELTIDRLCLYSTVCGCGLDMVPVPGDLLPEDLASLLYDVAALSSVLRKPLGVRVLPIPMRAANELTKFNHDFLVNTRILPLEGQGLPVRFPAEEIAFYD